jgi:hypothetical protein
VYGTRILVGPETAAAVSGRLVPPRAWIARCEAMRRQPPGPEWDGVFDLETKEIRRRAASRHPRRCVISLTHRVFDRRGEVG